MSSAITRADNVSYDVFDGRAVLVDPRGRELITLNRTGTVVWEAIDGRRSGDDLVEVVAGRFPTQARATVAADVGRFLDELSRLKVVNRR